MKKTSKLNQSLLPMRLVGEDGKTVVEEIVCDSIAGGRQEVDGMPKHLSLMRFRDGRLIGWADYEFAKSKKVKGGKNV